MYIHTHAERHRHTYAHTSAHAHTIMLGLQPWDPALLGNHTTTELHRPWFLSFFFFLRRGQAGLQAPGIHYFTPFVTEITRMYYGVRHSYVGSGD